MVRARFKQLFLAIILAMFCIHASAAQPDREHVEVALRTIGHQLLLKSNDSTSHILPIKMKGGKFAINFTNNFAFEPSELRSTVELVFATAKITNRYRLQVRDVDTEEIVYSYELAPEKDSNLIPCIGREYPKDNYTLLITLLNNKGEPVSFVPDSQQSEEQMIAKQSVSSQLVLVLVIVLILSSSVAIYFWRKKQQSMVKMPNHTPIGKYQFDERNMKLIFNNESIDLTSKETDLLALLHSSLDETIEREKILKVVWGDEGDYVGRTLDVFISKLRKKFSEDENVRIVNVRGVGYRLMLSD